VRGGGGRGIGGFHFEANWLQEEKCGEVVEEAWKLAMEEPSQSTYNALKTVAASLSNWSHNVLGDLEKRVKKIKKELEECRRMGIDREQVVRESLLRYKLERVEEQIDIYWKQRAHIN
jgi:predicted transcriptional regulator